MYHKKTLIFATEIREIMDSAETPFYISVLGDEFLKRLEKNANYSVRAFARDLGLNPGHLRRIIFKERIMRLKTAMILSEKLGLNSELKHRFIRSLLH